MRINYELDIKEKGGICDWKKLYDLRDELERSIRKYFHQHLWVCSTTNMMRMKCLQK